jgi:hypothetical protein
MNEWMSERKEKAKQKKGEGDKKLNVLTIKLNPELMAK